MAAAAKAAQDEVRSKSKTKKTVELAGPVKKDGQKAAEPPTMGGIFDVPAPVGAKATPPGDSDEEAEILAEIKQDEETEEEDAAVVAS
jgi:hypothetical protein